MCFWQTQREQPQYDRRSWRGSSFPNSPPPLSQLWGFPRASPAAHQATHHPQCHFAGRQIPSGRQLGPPGVGGGRQAHREEQPSGHAPPLQSVKIKYGCPRHTRCLRNLLQLQVSPGGLCCHLLQGQKAEHLHLDVRHLIAPLPVIPPITHIAETHPYPAQSVCISHQTGPFHPFKEAYSLRGAHLTYFCLLDSFYFSLN